MADIIREMPAKKYKVLSYVEIGGRIEIDEYEMDLMTILKARGVFEIGPEVPAKVETADVYAKPLRGEAKNVAEQQATGVSSDAAALANSPSTGFDGVADA